MPLKQQAGFTLLEVLIALFVFTILSLMMTGALRTVIDAQSGTEQNAERLRQLQIVLVRLSRDVEQMVNRPVKTNSGQDASAFYGTARGFSFTHIRHQGLQRTQYSWEEGSLWRSVWEVLDQAANSPKPTQRLLLEKITDARFEYLDNKQIFHAEWPGSNNTNQPLPRAVRISLTITNWGTIRQIYVIPAETNATSTLAPTT